MPLDRRAVARRLHVELRAVEPDAGADELLDDADEPRVPVELLEPREEAMRRLDPPHAGRFRPMPRLQIVHVGVRGEPARLVEDLAHLPAEALDQRRLEHARHHHIPVLAIGRHVAVRDHLELSLWGLELLGGPSPSTLAPHGDPGQTRPFGAALHWASFRPLARRRHDQDDPPVRPRRRLRDGRVPEHGRRPRSRRRRFHHPGRHQVGEERGRHQRASRAVRGSVEAGAVRRAHQVAPREHEPAALSSERPVLRRPVRHLVDGHRRDVRPGRDRARPRGQLRHPLRRGRCTTTAPRARRPSSRSGGWGPRPRRRRDVR